MATYEQLGKMTYIDDIGNQHILYPVTKKECVEGLIDIEDAIGDLEELQTDIKTNLVDAINEVKTNRGDTTDIQSAINNALQEAKDSGLFNGRGIVSIIRTDGNGAAGTVDTYTITYTDGSTSTFNVYNGSNGASGGGSGVPGESGENGATFTPYVDENGNLSWVNDKGLPNPSTVNIKGNTGEDGAIFTPTVSTSGDLSWSNDKGLPNPATVNIKGLTGENGNPGEGGATFIPSVNVLGDLSWTNDKDLPNPPAVNIKGETGSPGENGISCTHFWDGTTLSITSASGTSSADLVGPTGINGVSVTKVEQTVTSGEDGGTNTITITLSNGQEFTFNVNNGSRGSKGDPGENATINGVNALTLNGGGGISLSTNDDGITTIAGDLTSLLHSGPIILNDYHYGNDLPSASRDTIGRLFFLRDSEW